MNCSTGQILRVNLTDGKISVENIDTVLLDRYVGGRGLGMKILSDELDPMVDPFSPENKLVFTTGRFNGINVIASGRFMVMTKSPLTGTIACPNCGGFLGPELKFAGYDMVIIEGKSPKPVYLSIENDNVTLKSAEHLWGKFTEDTEKAIRSEMADEWQGRDAQIACIGPGGENLVRMACIMHAEHSAARSGAGAVMGSKNLKAVAVRGTRGFNVADSEALRRILGEQIQKYVKNTEYLKRRVAYGTWIGVPFAQGIGELPTRNFEEGYYPEWANFDLDQISAEYRTGTSSCFFCPYSTHKKVKTTKPGLEGCGAGPEFETTAAFGSNCGVDDFGAACKANYVCNELGIDTIDMGVSISCAMELYEKGYLPEADAGYKLNFGNVKAMIELITKTGYRQDFGNLLAEGGYRMAEKYGHPELFMGVKKTAMALHHPQACQNFGLAYATANQGANHTKHRTNYAERTETKGAAVFIKDGQDYITLGDCLGLCRSLWGYQPLNGMDLPMIMEAALGNKYTFQDLLLIGERIWNMERIFNLRAGITAKDDTLPKKILEHPFTIGPSKGLVVKLHEMLPEYYEHRGWTKDGIPTPEKLSQLGLDESIAVMTGLTKGG